MEIFSLAARYEGILASVKAAAQKSGRSPESVLILGVTKNVGADRMLEAYRLGIHAFGENRVQEWESKAAALASLAPRWHLIGHLQTNKAKRAVGAFALIHSVDSWKVAETLDREARAAGLVQSILLQVNTSGETSKYGLAPLELQPVLARVRRELPGIQVRGLMTMAPYADDPETVRPCFQRLRELRDESNKHLPVDQQLEHLSMGMSRDFAVAVEEGATIIRIGTGLFGAR
ncbi:MAG: YggS family pyridoxal phosphate-dependent enzyme [Cyanobacteria bacterium RYN_339]|nr:YggS family pyridoxal phosphate-dependent enzyme [Cyanobacteria bacterium RYN_339]